MVNTHASNCLADFDGNGSETQRGLGVRNSDLENDEDEDEDDLEEKDDDEDDLESLLRHDDYHKDVEKTKVRKPCAPTTDSYLDPLMVFWDRLM